jgi:colicin import membrane protein
MKATKHSYANRYQAAGNDSRLVRISFGISIAIHVIFLGTLILMPQSGSGNRFSSSVVNVSLVSMPGKAPGAGPAAAPAPAPPKKTVKKPAKAEITKITPPSKKPVVQVKKPKDTVSLNTKPKKKASLKKKTLDRSKMIKGAIDDVQKKVEDKQSASLSEALNRLKKRVEETETATPQPYPPVGTKDATGSPGAVGTGGGGTGGGPRTLEAIKIYQAEIQYLIQKNWAFSQQLAGHSHELEAVLAIKIMRNGEIEDIWFDKRSGNDYLDESAYRALVKSNPLPSLPGEYIGSHYKIGLIFGPKGLK